MKKTSVGIALLFLLSFAMIAALTTSDSKEAMAATTFPDTKIRSLRNPGDENVTSYPILNPDFSSYVYSDPKYWFPTKGGTDQSYIHDTWYSTSGYKNSPCVGIYMNQPKNQPSKQAYEYWYQDWIYNGTVPPTSANVTFRWKYTISNFRLTGSNNTLSILIQYPAGSGPAKLLLRRVINETSSYVANQWYSEAIDIKNYLTSSSNTTKYRIMLRFDCMTSAYAPNSGYFYAYWDDVIVTARYPPQFPPGDLSITIVGTSTNQNYTNSADVALSVSGRGLNRIGFSNDKIHWFLYNPTSTLNWTLATGDGAKIVYFNASNSKGVTGPVNDTIILDQTAPNVPVLTLPDNGTITNDITPTFDWSLVSDRGPSGMAGYLLEVHPVPTFNSPDNRTYFLNASTWTFPISLSPGFWYWRIASQDKADNKNYTTARVIAVDNIPPERVYLNSPADGYASNNKNPSLAWLAASDNPPFPTGVAGYTLQLDTDSSFSNSTGKLQVVPGLSGTSYTISASKSLADGTWYWRVNATDLAGNIGYAFTRSFIVDTVPPLAPGQLSVPTGGSKPTFSWSLVSDAVGYIIEIDNSPSFDNRTGRMIREYTGTSGYTVSVDLPNGNWYWRVRSEDAATNIGNWSVTQSFVVNVMDPLMVTAIAGGGTGGAAFLLIMAYYFVRKSRIPFVIKKIDQSIKLISKGDVPQPVPMRTRSQVMNGIYEAKLAIMSKEKLEEAEGKKKRVPKEVELSPEMPAPKTVSKSEEAPAKAEAEESDVELVAKELEKLEGKEEKSVDENELIKREIDELEKGLKKKKGESDE